MGSISQYLESIPSDLLKPIELKNGALILNNYMLSMFDGDNYIGTVILTPVKDGFLIEIRTHSVMRMPYIPFTEIEKRLKNYFNILGLKVSVYCRNPNNPFGVLI